MKYTTSADLMTLLGKDFVFTGGNPLAGINVPVALMMREHYQEISKFYEEKYQMSEIQPPAVVDAQVVDVAAEDVRAAAEAQLAKEAEMNAGEPQPLSFFEFLKLLRAESPIVSFNCEPTEDGHMYLSAQVFNETGTTVAEDGSKWKNFESKVTGQFYVTPEGQVIVVNAPGPLKSEAPIQ